jgi:hypothetical protein
MGRTGRPQHSPMSSDTLRHRRLRMTGTEPHAPRGAAGRGTNRDCGPCAGHAGAARRCTRRHRRPSVSPGLRAVLGPRELCVDACTSRYRRPRDPQGDRGLRAGRRSCVTRSGPTCLRMRISASLAARPARGLRAVSGPEELRDSERSRGCRRGAVTVCFQYLVPQVTVSDYSTCYSELAELHSELGVAAFESDRWTVVPSIKADGEETRQS